MPSHKHIFDKYRTNYFIETGTFEGQGVEYALAVGYPNVKSVDIDRTCFSSVLNKYKEDTRVSLFCGTTESQLWEMIKDINEQCTFWLDAHWSGPGTPMSHQKCPLLDELAIIAKHPIKNHIIMIDDIRCCLTDYFNFMTKEVLEKKIKDINPNYVIVYEDSWEKKDILCAFVP